MPPSKDRTDDPEISGGFYTSTDAQAVRKETVGDGGSYREECQHSAQDEVSHIGGNSLNPVSLM